MKKALLKEIMQNAQKAKALNKFNANLGEFLKAENQNYIVEQAQKGEKSCNIKLPYFVSDEFLAKLKEDSDLDFERAYHDGRVLIVKWSD